MATSLIYKRGFFLSVVTIVVVATMSFGIYEYHREREFRCDILHAKLQLNNYTQSDSSIRLTIIDTAGNVVFDSKEKNIKKMENHKHRKEVCDAIRTGSGFDIKRASETDGETYFYSATYFPERGEIVRSAVPYSAPLTASLERNYTFFYYTAGILLLIAAVLYLRYRLSCSEQEKQRIKRQLTENAAHELKTPAATIMGYLETLVDNPNLDASKRNEFIQKCYNQSKRMSRLLMDMSILTRLDEAHIEPPNSPVDASSILHQLIQDTEIKFSQKNIKMDVEVEDSLMVKGDVSMLYSVFGNIIDNTLYYATGATDFIIKGEITGRGEIRFQFSDNGPGVPEKDLEHIFERFYRVDKGRSRQMGGTGLGLAIVKNIVLQYRGSVNAHPTKGGGLTIEITFPSAG